MGSFERFKTKTHFNSLKRLVGITALAALAVKLLAVAETGGLRCDINGSAEMGVGNAANLHLAASSAIIDLPGTIPVTSTAEKIVTKVAGHKYLDDIITEPFEYVDGCFRVPTGPGLGVTVDLAVARHRIRNVCTGAYEVIDAAVKDVGVLYALGDERVNRAVMSAHHEGVAEAVAYLDAHVGTRRGHQQHIQVQVDIREPEPDHLGAAGAGVQQQHE